MNNMIGELTHEEFLQYCDQYSAAINKCIYKYKRVFLPNYNDIKELKAMYIYALVVSTAKYYRKNHELGVNWYGQVFRATNDMYVRYLRYEKTHGATYLAREIKDRVTNASAIESILTLDNVSSILDQFPDQYSSKDEEQIESEVVITHKELFWEMVEFVLYKVYDPKNRLTDKTKSLFLKYYRDNIPASVLSKEANVTVDGVHALLQNCRRYIKRHIKYVDAFLDEHRWSVLCI